MLKNVESLVHLTQALRPILDYFGCENGTWLQGWHSLLVRAWDDLEPACRKEAEKKAKAMKAARRALALEVLALMVHAVPWYGMGCHGMPWGARRA